MGYEGNETFLLLGGGGMIGQQIAYEIARELNPKRIIVCALTQDEANSTVKKVKRDFKGIKLRAVAGNVFVRHEWSPSSGGKPVSPGDLTKTEERREALFDDTFGKIEDAYPHSELVWLIEEYAPDVIIDSINTATAISYQDVYSASKLAKKKLGSLKAALCERPSGVSESTGDDTNGHASQAELVESSLRVFEEVLSLQSVPQLVRHVLLINRAMREVGTRLYLKVGTTGTGGMGLNIPYTHSEDSPSAQLMEKTAVAFAQTGLLYLMARTLGGPAVKEFKPAAMVGYADIGYRQIKVKDTGKIGRPGSNVKLYSSRSEPLGGTGKLRLRPPRKGRIGYRTKGDLQLAVVNTGENGVFTKGEFQAITNMHQMEFITPEEIAGQAVLEIIGSNTGYDVIAAIDGASMNPTYRAGHLRHFAIEELGKLEEEKHIPSVALGELGPPELGKLLWEAYLLHKVYEKEKGTKQNELDKVLAKSKDDLAHEVFAYLKSDERDQLRNTIVSVGLPILGSDGKSLIRGPYIRIHERKNDDTVPYEQKEVDEWADRGWVDLRPENMERWRQRFLKMKQAAERIRERGSAAFTREGYLSDEIKIGVVVGWIFNNELKQYRIK